MKLVSMKCPQCLGTVVPFGDGAMGRCECCDSVFSLKDADEEAASEEIDEEEEEEDDEEEEFDFEEFFDDFASELNEDDEYEFFVGTDLETAKGKTKIEGAKKYFGVEDDEDIYLVLDTTVFGSCKVGLACCTSGIYMKDEDGDQCFLNWEDFASCELEVDGGRLTICNSPFITQATEAELLYDLFDELQDAL